MTLEDVRKYIDELKNGIETFKDREGIDCDTIINICKDYYNELISYIELEIDRIFELIKGEIMDLSRWGYNMISDAIFSSCLMLSSELRSKFINDGYVKRFAIDVDKNGTQIDFRYSFDILSTGISIVDETMILHSFDKSYTYIKKITKDFYNF